MKARVVTDAIVGGGLFLRFGDQIEVEALGEYAQSMLDRAAIVILDPVAYSEKATLNDRIELR